MSAPTVRASRPVRGGRADLWRGYAVCVLLVLLLATAGGFWHALGVVPFAGVLVIGRVLRNSYRHPAALAAGVAVPAGADQ